MRNLAVYSLPTMHHLYSIEVSDVSSLVQIGITMVSLIMYFLSSSNVYVVNVVEVKTTFLGPTPIYENT